LILALVCSVDLGGNGHREGGIGAIDFYTERKSVYVDYSDKLQNGSVVS
jgi:alpha-ketoglutaric semialdehyde dehydrogenase